MTREDTNGLHPIDEQLLSSSQWDFSDLKALYTNCTLKRSPEVSNTQGLADRSIAIMRHAGVEVDVIRAVDREIATGVYPDMTEHGWPADEWPAIFERCKRHDARSLKPSSDDRTRTRRRTSQGQQHLESAFAPDRPRKRCRGEQADLHAGVGAASAEF